MIYFFFQPFSYAQFNHSPKIKFCINLIVPSI
nr:MAG TPA: hypothetical protein [Caudoviricetes sp.]